MTAEEKECIKSTVLPVILGNGAEAHKISAHLFASCEITALICGKKSSVRDFFSTYSRFERLSESDSPEILRDELIGIAKRYSEYLLLLVPSNDEYKDLLEKLSEELETRFIIRSPNDLFKTSPIADISAD